MLAWEWLLADWLVAESRPRRCAARDVEFCACPRLWSGSWQCIAASCELCPVRRSHPAPPECRPAPEGRIQHPRRPHARRYRSRSRRALRQILDTKQNPVHTTQACRYAAYRQQGMAAGTSKAQLASGRPPESLPSPEPGARVRRPESPSRQLKNPREPARPCAWRRGLLTKTKKV